MALRGTDNGSCHFHCTVLAALSGAGVCFCLFHLLNVVYLPIFTKLGLVVGMTKQMPNGKEADMVRHKEAYKDIVNPRKSCRTHFVRST